MVLRQNDSSYDHAVFTDIYSPMTLRFFVVNFTTKANLGSDGAEWERGSKNL